MNEKSTALCPCQSGNTYQDCCQPLHQQRKMAQNAEQLMRSRYAAFVLQQIDYIVETTVPSQQNLLDYQALKQWAAQTQWLGLEIIKHEPELDKKHSAVEFNAQFASPEGKQIHHEKSLFVKVDERWYFADPTVSLPAMKQPCICGSGKKFKHCCGVMLCQFYGEN
ncbi:MULTISPECIES: YchJ family protein [unclassified Avibacterium]|uniref:YchJ family protein n=1 Tax=unclassified Avibacterium TaxID=2685287 RepID=UPI0020268518|nr:MULTISPECIES: YchJ family protein [unclassified Avibacterium]MCW9699063.1 YchJ family protein [Avibacterium sp. 20-129]MCW9733057.1 YchJ family protein [Avibacterium sp. 20-15]URL01934.1 YchJ family protein [Avibacterium sp. 20-126]URL05185.1 YchJ family protein [Avibacterium sp. 20-132]